jgi:hypothetical protein
MSELSPEELDFLTTRGASLLREIGFGDRMDFQRLAGGRNNRVYRVLGDGPPVVVKWYFRHAEDQRDRLQAEFAFCEFAKTIGAECVASPLARSDTDRLAVYTSIDGRRLAADEVDESSVGQALDFFRTLNSHRETPAARRLPVASEACFSLQEHVDCVSARVSRLQSIAEDSAIHKRAVELVNEKLASALDRSVERLRDWAEESDVGFSALLPMTARCVSPSDFGFHNALVQSDGKLCFVDFEYAGWDDPAKMVCDFYCQVETPAPRATWPRFSDAATELAADGELERHRQEALLPLYQLKWCCIVLNEFTATSTERREFATAEGVDLQQQFDKARRLAEALS